MNRALEQIVNAILYEGYILYPYRASSQKNQRARFTFGRVYPQIFSEKENGAEPCAMQTECLFRTRGESPQLRITVGFLQPIVREIGACETILEKLPENGEFRFQNVPQLEVAGKTFQAWMEAVERKVSTSVNDFHAPVRMSFVFPASESREAIQNETGGIEGMIFRRHEVLEGRIETKMTRLQDDLFRICVRVVNLSSVKRDEFQLPEKVLLRTFASTHFTLEAESGEFVSLLETPPELRLFADDCKNIGCWPVLAGDKAAGDRKTILASPIILYDYPQLATESTVEFFDGTEIDEMLTLRVLAMSDAEKKEIQAEEISRRVLERTSALNTEDILRLHGTLREPKAVDEGFFNPAQRLERVCVNGTEFKIGDRVVIHPKHRADAFDLMLAGKTAVIESIEQSVDGEVHLAVVLENDPGSDLGMARQPGHRFFYKLDEVEPVKREEAA